MSQHDYDIANASGASVRSDLNNVLAAIVSQNSGASAPSTTFAYMLWADTTNNVLWQRNAANTGWIIRHTLDNDLVVAKTASYTVTLADCGKLILVDASGGAVTITLPAVATATEGFVVTVKATNVDNTVTIDGDGAETIDGDATMTLDAVDDAVRLKVGNGAWYTESLPGGGGAGTQGLQSVQVFTSSGTWTRPAGITKVIVDIVGGGGGGGGSTGATGGSRGGNGGMARKFVDVSALASVSVTVGAAGAGSASGTGGTGGTSSFGAHAGATGGSGGAANTTTGYGAGGAGSGGELNWNGGTGLERATISDAGTGGAGAPPTGTGTAGVAGKVVVWEYA